VGELVPEVRRAEDIEAVHRMRVASRRLRNAMDLFFDELPAARRSRWLKRLGGVTRALGHARDLDVQIAFLTDFAAAARDAAVQRGVERLLGDYGQRRARVQKDVVRAMDRLEAAEILKQMGRWVRRVAPEQPARRWCDAALRTEAIEVVAARLADLRAFEQYVERPECVAELHAMRIAAKHLRYTLEVYEPLYSRGLKTHIRWARSVQDVLGALHDCDVWLSELPQRASPSRSGALEAGRAALLADRGAKRRELYAQFVTEWRRTGGQRAEQRLRRTLGAPRTARQEAIGGKPGQALPWSAVPFDGRGRHQWAATLALARACRYEAAHAHQVTGLALRLFDELAEYMGLRRPHRAWLTHAGLLHDIGWVRGQARHHKTAQRLITESSKLAWSARQRAIVGAVARYHRGALPRLEQRGFGALPGETREIVRKLGALLRLADGLDYTHQGLVRDVECRVGRKEVEITCSVRASADEEIARARQKSDLLGQVLGRRIEVQCRPPTNKASKRS